MSKKIMIVDDEPVITSTLSMLLEMMLEEEVITYNNPKEALEDKDLKHLNIDLVISDFMMPELNGFEFLKAVQNIDSNCMTILLTGYADKSNAIKCINELNLYYYLEKPWVNEDLLKVITNAFETQRLNDALNEKMIGLEKANKEISNLYDLLKTDYDTTVNEKSMLQDDLLHSTMDMRQILNYADQGFLILNKDLSVYNEYSQKCLEFFMKDITGENFASLIYPNDLEQQDFLNSILKDILKSDDNRVNMYLPLLPDEVILNRLPLHITYRLIKQTHNDDQAFFITLSDFSQHKLLESKLEKEGQILQMVVGAFSNAQEIKEIIRDYHFFIETTLSNIGHSKETFDTVFRQIHTFKGLCAQLKLHHSANRLHEIESLMAKAQDPSILKTIRFEEVMTKDLEIFDQYLGQQFLNITNDIIVDKEKIIELEKLVLHHFNGKDLSIILEKINQLRYRPIEELLKNYVPYLEELSENLNKPMNQLAVTGGDLLVDHDAYREFFKSLIHVIRNMIDHGIEPIEERALLNKPYNGSISINIIEGKEEMVIILENDGRPFDLDKIKQKSGSKGIDTSHMTDSEIMMLVFEQDITTKEKATSLSGRGVGLAAVKHEVERLSGQIFLESDDRSTRYIFKLPFYKGLISENKLVEILAHAMEMYIEQSHMSYSRCESNCVDTEDIYGVKIDLKGLYDCQIVLFMKTEFLNELVQVAACPLNDEFRIELLKEAANIIMGNALQMMPGSEHLIDIGLPSETTRDIINDNTVLFSVEENSIFMGIEIKGENNG